MVKYLLVIDESVNWFAVFKGAKLPNGEEIKVDQTRWKDIHVEASAESGCICSIRKADEPFPFSPQKEDRQLKPDFLLIRNFPTDLHNTNYRSILIAFVIAGIPSVNSLKSILVGMDRPLMYAELLNIQRKLGVEKFPLIPLKYHPNGYLGTKQNLIPFSKFPAVIKVGSTHAGFGKIIAHNEDEYFDVESILALNSDYFTMEPKIDYEYEFRIQKLGNHYRTFRRNSSTSWKGNWGNIKFEDHEMKEEYKMWVDECSKICGGLDIFAIDVLHGKDGKDYILEMNDTANGLDFRYEKEDLQHIREVVIEKMNSVYNSNEN